MAVVLAAAIGIGGFVITRPASPTARAGAASAAATPSGASPVSSAPATAGGTFTDPGHDFSIDFPTAPTSTSSTTTTTGGVTIQYTVWEAEDTATGEAYAVIDMPYPPSISITDPQQSLETGVNSMVTGLGATLVSQSSGSYQGYPDQDALLQLGIYAVEYQFVLAGHTFYGAGVESTQDPPPGFSAFVDSLQIYSTSGAT